MLIRMKTTIDLPDALAEEARRVARESGLSLRQVVVSGLRAELDRRAASVEQTPFRFTTVGGRGLRAGVDPARLTDHAYDLPPS